MILVHSQAEILAMINDGLCPTTDNFHTLKCLGFKRQFPDISTGDKAHLWIRFISKGYQHVPKKGGYSSYEEVKTRQRVRLSFIAENAPGAQPAPNKAAAMRHANRLNDELLCYFISPTLHRA